MLLEAARTLPMVGYGDKVQLWYSSGSAFRKKQGYINSPLASGSPLLFTPLARPVFLAAAVLLFLLVDKSLRQVGKNKNHSPS
ncbi:MAG: hypothetical protein AAFX57_20875 [Bacteroidota bacterium]